MPDLAYKSSPEATPSVDPTAPLRDWLSTISRRDSRQPELRAAEPEPRDDERRVVEMPRPRAAAARPVEPEEAEDVEALIAENLVLRAKLKAEAEHLGRIQELVAEELRGLRAMVREEAERAEALREERDLWMARAEALAQPLFQRR